MEVFMEIIPMHEAGSLLSWSRAFFDVATRLVNLLESGSSSAFHLQRLSVLEFLKTQLAEKQSEATVSSVPPQ
ncbi:hypothetical protein SCA6_000836 [Theobroma cacao]